jgi:hypothetical protein
MKLIRFTIANAASASFGVVIQEQAVPFDVLQKKAGKSYPYLTDGRSYLADLPESERAAKDMLAGGEQHLGDLGDVERFRSNAARSPGVNSFAARRS